MSTTCRLCNKRGSELRGSYLTRVNPLGEIGIWECRPSCTSNHTQEELLLMALESNDTSSGDSVNKKSTLTTEEALKLMGERTQYPSSITVILKGRKDTPK